MRSANWSVVEDKSDRVVLQDVGPWDKYPTITNDAEEVVRQIAPGLRGRRLFYYDSEGRLDELVVKDGVFSGFRPGGKNKINGD